MAGTDRDLIVLENVLQRLKTCKFGFLGELYGFQNGSNIYAITFIIKEDEANNYQKYQKISSVSENNFPHPIQLIGLVYGDESDVHVRVKNDFEQSSCIKIQAVLEIPQPVIIAHEYGKSNTLFFRYLRPDVIGTSAEIISDIVFWCNFAHFRISVGFYYSHDGNDEINTKTYIEEKQTEINRGDVEFKCQQICLNGRDDRKDGTKCLKNVINNSEDETGLIKFTLHNEEHPVLLVKMNVTGNNTCEMFNPDVDAYSAGDNHRKNDPKLCDYLIIDSLMIANKNESLSVLYEQMKNSVCRSLKLVSNYFDRYNIPYRVYHFYVPELGHWFSTLYPVDVVDHQLTEIREYYHFAFNLPRTGPVFTRGKSFLFRMCQEMAPILKNVHIGLKPSGMEDGQVTLINGPYEYYHYKQLGINDSGWGCAYRSLQTVFSWYKLQGWTDKLIPSHSQIQQILVDIGDKPKEFVGSRQWIGSFEVSYVLDSLLGVTCRMLTVQKGESISTLAYEIADHFERNGPPIMIGGGNLAHTIIGVEINVLTDETRFLILDPHYTGPDNIGSIQSKQGVAWKKLEFWKSNTFYNLCLPLKMNSEF